METIDEILLERLHDNQKSFLDEVKQKYNADEIINAAYEIVIKEDILSLLECEDNLFSEKQVNALLKLKNPLNELYDGWLHSDYSHMDMLRDCIADRANDVMKSMSHRTRELER